MSPDTRQSLRFAWWNLNDFAHYDPNSAAMKRWPGVEAEYRAKCERMDAAFRFLRSVHSPDLIGVCEITATAASELRDRVFPDYELAFADPLPDATFQVAVLYRGEALHVRQPLVALGVPRTTREMVILDWARGEHHIRFAFCHWTAFGESASVYRERLAEAVAADAFDFLATHRRQGRIGHYVVVGDLNTEPFDALLASRLHASRDRDRARTRPHASDADVRRVRFYNPCWRVLGEGQPHTVTSALPHWAGTYYNHLERRWHTYDQILVTGGLLASAPPYFDEVALRVLALPQQFAVGGKPRAFEWNEGAPFGASDHLPLTGQFVLPSE